MSTVHAERHADDHYPRLQSLGTTSDHASQSGGLRQPCLWGEPDPILDRNMQPLQLSDAERQLLRSVHDQPDTPLGGLAEPAVIRDLAARQLLLLKA